jgi:hypothetical protein
MGVTAVIARRTGKTHLTGRNGPVKRVTRAGSAALSRAEVAEFKETLLLKRRQLLGDIGAMEDEGVGDAPELLDSEWDLLREIDRALARIENGTYGICEATGTRITKARLRACPWARYCIEYARRNERPKAPVTPAYRWPEDDADERPAPDAWEVLRQA